MNDASLKRKIVQWYTIHQRDLPWRRTKDPYAILVSEIMLQQTQVDRVIPKYQAFLKKFPTPHALARASSADVLRLWSGLGYNRRALYLKRAAESIDREGWPKTEEGLRALPGIGEYTAGALLSFAFGKRALAFDVNVERVLRRAFFGMNLSSVSGSRMPLRDDIKSLAIRLLPRDASTWQQALMDIGALFCRATPRCALCPLRSQCASAPFFLRGGLEQRVKKQVVSFRESARFVRGQIMKILTTKKASGCLLSQMLEKQDVSGTRVSEALDALCHEGLIEKRGVMYFLRET